MRATAGEAVARRAIMESEQQYAAIGAWLTEQTGRRFASRPAESVHGGSIHRCVRWPGRGGDAFLKLGPPTTLSAYEAEVEGLRALRRADALRVPGVYAVGSVGPHAILALEWLDLSPVASGEEAVQAQLGERLAAQHRVTAATFGWRRDNTIGATPQPNTPDDDWVRFFRQRRLGHQLELAATQGLDRRIVARGRELEGRCEVLFAGHRPVPSLLHGDLWGGNWSALATTREPVIFDPAVYYGDREADIAFTRLFGGFAPSFYAAYQAAWPLEPGADVRRMLYNLYHVLNHYVLFGGSYARQASSMIEGLLAELG
ncbi:MAG TPA: fructosamine kinase family protein [Steroidobacteraceae bacterium]|nr:fructosamine kinase family protein [Steroidobacteraceae bacterium]